MWRDYFGARARIIGIDLNPKAQKWEKEGFEIFIGNQSDRTFWTDFIKTVGNLDVVLDDGGHTYRQQITTTECLIDAINDGGLLLVEDTHTSYMRGFGFRGRSFIQYTKKRIDAINMRFSEFNRIDAERRIWSIEIIESMVGFKVNNEATNLISKPIANSGKHEFAEDYRYLDFQLLLSVRWLKHIVFKFFRR